MCCEISLQCACLRHTFYASKEPRYSSSGSRQNCVAASRDKRCGKHATTPQTTRSLRRGKSSAGGKEPQAAWGNSWQPPRERPRCFSRRPESSSPQPRRTSPRRHRRGPWLGARRVGTALQRSDGVNCDRRAAAALRKLSGALCYSFLWLRCSETNSLSLLDLIQHGIVMASFKRPQDSSKVRCRPGSAGRVRLEAF